MVIGRPVRRQLRTTQAGVGRRGVEIRNEMDPANVLNPQYAEIARVFVTQYYSIFDDPVRRPTLVNMYNSMTSFMTFEGQQIQGSQKIEEKLTSLTFQKIHRMITAIDSQPMFDGGILINVLGRLQCDEDPPHGYNHVFLLQPLGTSFFIQHDIFRLALHNTA